MSEYILSFDPGGTTGWALTEVPINAPLTLLVSGQIPDGVDGFADWVMIDMPLALQPCGEDSVIHVVSESFHVRPGVPDPDITPLKIEGAQAVLFGRGVVNYQTPSMKSMCSDDSLRAMGLWQKGNRHANDAIIHAVVYAITKLKHMPTIEFKLKVGEDVSD